MSWAVVGRGKELFMMFPSVSVLVTLRSSVRRHPVTTIDITPVLVVRNCMKNTLAATVRMRVRMVNPIMLVMPLVMSTVVVLSRVFMVLVMYSNFFRDLMRRRCFSRFLFCQILSCLSNRPVCCLYFHINFIVFATHWWAALSYFRKCDNVFIMWQDCRRLCTVWWEADSKRGAIWAKWLGIEMLSTYACHFTGKSEFVISLFFKYWNEINLQN